MDLRPMLPTYMPSDEIFVGRERERNEFRDNLRCLLRNDLSKSSKNTLSHIFLVYGEGGMGKSSLLYQFIYIAQIEGLNDTDCIYIDLSNQILLTNDLLSEMLAQEIRRQNPDFDVIYQQSLARYRQIEPSYRDLERQWKYWEMMCDIENGSSHRSREARSTPKYGINSAMATRLLEMSETLSDREDIFLSYEYGLQELLKRVQKDHPKYSDILVYQQRLNENISNDRNHGDTPELRSERSKIIESLNTITVSIFNMSFNDLCKNTKLSSERRILRHYSTDTKEVFITGLEDAAPAIQKFWHDYNYYPQSFIELLIHELGPSDAILFSDDNALDKILVACIHELSNKKVILIAIDTYEHIDYYEKWFFNLIRDINSERVIVISAGRRELPYYRYYSEKSILRIRSYNLNNTLSEEEVRQYLQARVCLSEKVPDDLVSEVLSICKGIPIALEAVGNHLISNGHLMPFLHINLDKLDKRAIIRVVVQRFLRDALADPSDDQMIQNQKRRDLQRIRALSLLLRPDPELVCAMLNVSQDEGLKLVSELANKYSFIFTDYSRYNLHTLVREFIRADTLDGRQQLFEWSFLKAGLLRVLQVVQDRIMQIEQRYADLDERYGDNIWQEAILDLLNARLWLGEPSNQAQHLLLNKWIEARHLNPSFADVLVALTTEIVSASKNSIWTRLVQATQSQDYDLLQPFVRMKLIEPHSQAVLHYLSSKRLKFDNIIDIDLKKINSYIMMLEEAYSLDTAWKPLRSALADAYSARGHYYLYTQKEYNAALNDFNLSLELQPDSSAALSRRGVTKRNIGDLQGALDDLNRALSFNRYVTRILMDRGLTQLQLGNSANALADINQVLNQFPDDVAAINSRGLVKYQSGNVIGAMNDFQRAFRLKNDFADPAYNIARIYASEGEINAMLSWLERAIRIDPSQRKRAYHDSAFEKVRPHPRFIELLGSAKTVVLTE